MAVTDLRTKLETLLDLLLQERELAQNLDMAGLAKVVRQKEALMATLKPRPEEVEGMQDLLLKVDHENRRNAFLLWTGLNWVREMMGFFGKAAMPEVYSGGGQSETLTRGGRLLSGRV